ncbi:hypothetical protein ABZ901_00775 [Actinacidiphila alni]|uniref:ThiF family adenylyltransferase n=1 Tax=Actinacidiphila alni TaxID=380248 RepID=UPI0033C6C883
MERISSRHEGDLKGRLAPIEDAQPVAVAVIVEPASAHLAAHQHTAWMLVNLLVRAESVVQVVRVICPPAVPLAGRVVPLAARQEPLDQALVQGGQAVGAVPVALATSAEPGDVMLVVGAQHGVDTPRPWRRRYVTGFGWWGGVSNGPVAAPAAAHGSPLPFGPYVAAALAVAEIFLHVRLPQHPVSADAPAYGWDCWSQNLSGPVIADAPAALEGLDLSGTALAGVGAVGSTWVHTLWATPDLRGKVLLADADDKGVTVTNLNRCPPFGKQHLNHPKADSAATLDDCTIAWDPRNARFEALGITPNLLVSAVDTNRAREVLQGRYPARILSASTNDLRAEALRVGPPGVGACLRCYNVPEAFAGDDDLRAQARAGGEETVAALAAEHGVSPTEVQHWLGRGECGEVGTRLLASLREQAAGDTPRFAVGFTSVMAGTLLAAETIKILLGQPLRAAAPAHNNVTFQFLKPTAPANSTGVLARDGKCPACSPTNHAVDVWCRRDSDFVPPRSQE